MNGNESLDALRRANPRHHSLFDETIERLTATAANPERLVRPEPRSRQQAQPAMRTRRSRPIAVGIPGAVLLTAIITIALLMVGSPLGLQTVSPAAAMEQAAAVTATAADESGRVTVEITQDSELWAAKRVHWNGNDLLVTNEEPSRPGKGGDLLVVDGIMYAPHPERPGAWLELGPPESVDPDSGTTPAEYLSAVREDAGGETVRRIIDAMTDPTSTPGEDGSTTYQGHIPAGALARETATKDGTEIRVLPYGYVAHDGASDPSSQVAITITVGPDSRIQEIAATWGGASNWTLRLTYSDLGSAPALSKPDNVEPLRRP